MWKESITVRPQEYQVLQYPFSQKSLQWTGMKNEKMKAEQQRFMNMNSHFAWALGFWGSANYSKDEGNYMMSSIGFYYSVFHAGFSLLNTDHTMHLKDLKRTTHKKLESKLTNHLDLKTMDKFRLLKEIRESINYLGMETPSSKLRIVRGHEFGFDMGKYGKLNFFELIEKANEESKSFILDCLKVIEKHYQGNKDWNSPKLGSDEWLEEYLQEDVLMNIIPDINRGKILTKAFGLIGS